jgi:hypothetical protein
MHKAFVGSVQRIAESCEAAGANPDDSLCSTALTKFSKSKDFTQWRNEWGFASSEALEARVRELYDRSDRPTGTIATYNVVDSIGAAMGSPITENLQAVFHRGHNGGPGWVTLFEIYFREEVKANTAVFRANQFDRSNEILAGLDRQLQQLDRIERSLSGAPWVSVRSLVVSPTKDSLPDGLYTPAAPHRRGPGILAR